MHASPHTRMYTRQDIQDIYDLPFPDVMHKAQTIHRQHFDPTCIQSATLLSIKTGGCKEDCAYCPQSAHYKTGLPTHGLLPLDQVLRDAQRAKDQGASRFCMGAAWTSPPEGPIFENVLTMVRGVNNLGLEVCVTLGMLSASQAKRLKEAGVWAYNHNLDTSPEYYGKIITTRTYQDRLDTLKHVADAGMVVCCGGIVGMGESTQDRIGWIEQLTHLTPPPESVPINLLVHIQGTPLGDLSPPAVDPLSLVRMVATLRILLPTSKIRLSAGRDQLSEEAHALCFLAGANSFFFGDLLLTSPNQAASKDHQLLQKLGMHMGNVYLSSATDTYLPSITEVTLAAPHTRAPHVDAMGVH